MEFSRGAELNDRLSAKAFRGQFRDVHWGDRIFAGSLKWISVLVALIPFLIAFFLWGAAEPALSKFKWGFISGSAWDPVQNDFGALPVIWGTAVSSSLAVLLATPLSIGVALFLNELVPGALRKSIGFLVEMLAAIPSVVYGLWGIFVLAPWLRTAVEPALSRTLGFLPPFRGAPYGVGMLSSVMILAIMVTPTISSICREIFAAVPRAQREAALALGATRWEMMRISVLSASKGGIFGAVILGLGRAVGETMAVTMVIGNRAQISLSLFDPAQTMASVIANEYAEATGDLHLSALAAIGWVLFMGTLIMNALARAMVRRVS